MRAIATHATNIADWYEEIDSEYDPLSDHAVFLRNLIIEACADIWRVMATAPGDLRWRLGRGMDRAQKEFPTWGA